MDWDAGITALFSLSLKDGQAEYRLTLPDWGRWLALLDTAARGQADAAQADPEKLMLAFLRGNVEWRPEPKAPFRPLANPGDLPAPLADRLIATASERLEDLRSALAPEIRQETAGRVCLSAAGHDFHLRPLTFAERNACLRGALHLDDAGAQVDAGRYELALLSASLESDPALTFAHLRALPMVLGEALIAEARRLSDPAADAELAAFAAAGLPHPDLELAALCLTYRISPEEAEALPGATARRLGAAARLLAASQPTPSAATQFGTGSVPDNVTRITVNDD